MMYEGESDEARIYNYSAFSWNIGKMTYIFCKEAFNVKIQSWIHCCKLHRQKLQKEQVSVRYDQASFTNQKHMTVKVEFMACIKVY